MKKHLPSRILALVLAVVMVVGQFPTVSAAPRGLRFRETDLEVSLDRSGRLVEDTVDESIHKPTDMVRVSIVLEKAPTLNAGFSTMDISKNEAALNYNAALQKEQEIMEKTISRVALNGQKLDVVWNLTLAGNMISANVPYGKIDAIAAIDGVAKVVIEQQYFTTEEEAAAPDMYTSADMIGSAALWQSGYTGAGSRVAIVDTGTDTDHQSFDNAAYLYALEQNAKAEGVSYEEYVASLDLLDQEEIVSVLPNLNATERVGAAAADYYISEKLPFGANYVDYNLVVDHDHDNQGSHGSHVAGIAAANRYVEIDGEMTDARESVYMNGVAPDAQIITLKVFGNAAGPYDSDYFAAIEDAIWLGADSVNLSLGSGSPGSSSNEMFADLLDYLATTDTVVVMSAGNSGYWAEMTTYGYLYNDGVSFHTGGSPGTYTNSLAVASVDNDGTIGKYIDVAGNMIVYTETEYRNLPISTLDKSADGSGTEYDYIFIDGIGNTADYDGMDLIGKVVFCSRGEISFFEKGNNAAELGAAAIVVYNNDGAAFGMDLTDYAYTAPCVSISQGDGAAVKAASTKQTTADGLVYYIGKVTVASKMGVSQYNSEYYTMSSFSSWGVPGSLEMKPEITAPGGMIWSVNGVDPSGSAYELMSGTSMAAPQITGMAALLAEYIREEGLDAQTGMSARHLAQSLLMSTAEPLREGASGGEYYSILNQGAGLGRIDLAATAESYVLVDGMADGKVKVELYDDPDREGVYEFSFTINNLNGEAMTYELAADLFTQDVFDGGNGVLYLDTWTRSLPGNAEFSVNGKSLLEVDFACDLNNDGITSADDADHLLEYLVGNESKLYADGDLNGDGNVTSYDAHVLLSKLGDTYSVNVPANGTVTVDVVLELTKETKAFLDAYYPTGAYIESFVYAEPISDTEGVQGVTHSIPVLGYYGSWTEPSMYDVGSYLEYTYGAENRVPYLYNLNGIQNNFVSIDYGDGDEYFFGGNPFVEEEEYLPQRNALNNKSGAYLRSMYFGLIRNAANSMVLIENADTGEVYLAQEIGEIQGAYYHVNQGAWQNTKQKLGLGLNFAGLPEGTTLNLSLVTAPELYVTDGVTDWNALAEGAYLTTTLTIDNTAPALKNVKLGESNTLSVTAKDNEYIAAVALLNATGTSIVTAAAANQTKAGAECTVELDLGSVFGSDFLVAVFDYAENVTTYEVTLELDNERPRFTGINRTDLNDDYSLNYMGLSADGTAVTLAPASGREPARAAEYVGGYVFEISNDNKLYVGSDADLFSFIYLGELDPTGEWEIVGFNDLAWNSADGKLYGNFYSEINGMEYPYLCTIDIFTGDMTVLGEMPIDACSMAIDDAGNFYSAIYDRSNLYTYTADVCQTGNATSVGTLSGYSTMYLNSMAWDHDTDELFWACTGDNTTRLLKIDPATAAVEQVAVYNFNVVGLYIAWDETGDILAPVNKVASVTVDAEAATLVNNTVQLNAQVWPWNVSNSAITWSSSNPDVAVVDETGLVYGMSEGTAVITATSVMDKSKSASCTVTISALDKDLKGLVWDENGQVWWGEFNTDTLPSYDKLNAVTPNLPVNATMVVDGTLYASTLDTSSGLSDLYIVDPETFEMTYAGGSPSIAYLDMAYAPSLGYGLGVYFNYVVVIDLESGDYLGVWDWGEGVAADLVGITYYGSAYNSNYGTNMDYFLLLDADGNAYLDAFINTGSAMGYFNGPAYGLVANIGDPVDYSYFQGFHYDGAYAYWTRFNEADNIVELIVWDCDVTGDTYTMGYFPEGVWPVGGLYTDAEINGTNALVDEELATAAIKDVELMAEIPTVELKAGKVGGGLNAALISTDPVVKPMSKGEATKEGNVTVEITIPTAATNGIMEITFDPEDLELTGVEGETEAFAWKCVNDTVTIAFAEGQMMPAESVVAALSFNALTEGETELTVTTGEWNDGSRDGEAENVTVTLPHICPSEAFLDVDQGRWYHEAIDYVVEKGYMNGVDDDRFAPNNYMTRAQFVTVLWRIEGEPKATVATKFTDVESGRFYTDAVAWAVEAGITTGITDTLFKPNNQVTRAQLVTFMYRYAEMKGYDISYDADVLDSFDDADEVPKFARKAFCWAVDHGIVNGVSETMLKPGNNATRAQAAAIFMRLDTILG